MRDPFVFLASNPSASPEQGAAVSASPETVKATFISRSEAAFFFVTALAWSVFALAITGTFGLVFLLGQALIEFAGGR